MILEDINKDKLKLSLWNDDIDKYMRGSAAIGPGCIISIAGYKLKPTTQQYSAGAKFEVAMLFGKFKLELISGPALISTSLETTAKIQDLLRSQPIGTTVNIAGIVLSVGAVTPITSAHANAMMKRELLVADDTGVIKVTLWGEKAMEEKGWFNNPMAFFGKLTVTNYGGCSLSLSKQGFFKTNPPELVPLYALLMLQTERLIKLIAEVNSTKSTSPGIVSYACISDVPARGSAQVSGQVSYLDANTYASCPSCKTKVLMVDGKWVCKACGDVPIPTHRFYVVGEVYDKKSSMQIKMFDGSATELLQVSADSREGSSIPAILT